VTQVEYSHFTSESPEKSIPASIYGVEPECLEYLRSTATPGNYKKNEIAMAIGESSPDIFIVGQGLLVVEGQYDPGVFSPVRFLSKGQGLATVFVPGEQSAFQLRALMPSQVARIPCAAVVEACQTWPKFSLGYTANLLKQASQSYLMQTRVGNVSLEVKLAYLLWSIGTSSPSIPEGWRRIPMRISQQMLGEYFNCPREEVNRKLKFLEKEGFWKKDGLGCIVAPLLETLFKAKGLVEPIALFIPLDVSRVLNLPATSG
jgi:CRP-like cAMP-binding protein